jgi:hypothetical protein
LRIRNNGNEENKKDIEEDRFDKLVEEQQRAMIRVLEQLDRGEDIPHEEALKLLKL